MRSFARRKSMRASLWIPSGRSAIRDPSVLTVDAEGISSGVLELSMNTCLPAIQVGAARFELAIFTVSG